MDRQFDDRIFPSGRHRNKTYLRVYETDKEFCRMVLSGEKSRFIPDDLLDFLLQKGERISYAENLIRARTAAEFAVNCDDDKYATLRRLIEKPEIVVKQVHPAVDDFGKSSGFLGVFHRLFVHKHVSNIAGSDANCSFVDEYAAIFPFKVNDSPELDDTDGIDDLMADIDDDLFDEMQTFLNHHFDGDEGNIDVRCVAKQFFANITNYRDTNVPESAVVRSVRGMNLKGLSHLDDSSVDNDCLGFADYDVCCEYLSTYPRVNRRGVQRYRQMYEMTSNVCDLYGKSCNVSASKYEPHYLLKLPEINLYELYSLLSTDFLAQDRAEYAYRFKKYIFFFINASKSTSKPVFFVDDALFECLQYYRIFRKSRHDVDTLRFEVSMVTLVYRRKQRFDEYKASYQPDDENLRNIKNYLTNFPGMTNAIVEHQVRTEILHSTAFIATDRVVMTMCFRDRRRNQYKSFFLLMLHASLSWTQSADFERLLIYNAYRGEESSIAMPSDKQSIIDFIRSHNVCDFSQNGPAEQFITEGFERCYKWGTPQWGTSRRRIQVI